MAAQRSLLTATIESIEMKCTTMKQRKVEARSDEISNRGKELRSEQSIDLKAVFTFSEIARPSL